MKILGLQLYSVRQDAEKDLLGTLKNVAEAGFNSVEFAGYYGYEAKKLKNILEDFGLTAISSHCGALENIYENIKYLNEVGADNIVVPHHPFESCESVLRFADEMNKAGKIYKENGLKLGYHNHSHEFKKDESGKYLLDIFYENTDQEYVKMQLDVCWARVAGEDPVSYLKKYGGRSETVHLKEVKTVDPYMGTAIGKGIIDFKGIYEVLGENFTYIAEQEEIEEDMWQALRDSAVFMNKNFT